MKNPIPEAAPSVQYRGLLVEFCCPGCDDKFLSKPDEYLDQELEPGQYVATFLFDPVAKTRIDKKGVKAHVIYRGVLYNFFGEVSKQTFEETPELFAHAPDRESIVCPIMKGKLPSPSTAYGYADFEGVRYYFCHDTCPSTFAADPARYAKALAKNVRTLKGQAVASGTQFMPTCAGCAGEARLVGADGFPTKYSLSYRYINIDKQISARHRWTFDYAVSPRLSVGIERAGSDSLVGPINTKGIGTYLKNSDGDAPILPRMSWLATPESATVPGVVIGFTSDRLSTPRGQAIFLTAAKHLPGGPLTAFASIKTSTFGGRTAFPFGVNTMLAPSWTLQTINDGDYTHLLLSKVLGTSSYSLIWARTRYLGFGVSIGF